MPLVWASQCLACLVPGSSGRPVARFSEWPEEEEYMFTPNTEFRVRELHCARWAFSVYAHAYPSPDKLLVILGDLCVELVALPTIDKPRIAALSQSVLP